MFSFNYLNKLQFKRTSEIFRESDFFPINFYRKTLLKAYVKLIEE